jgi:hypothetical protein
MRTFVAALTLFTGALAVHANEGPSVRLDAAGLRIDGQKIDGAILELRGAGDGALLASERCVEPLSGPLSVELVPGRTLMLEPGVRLERKGEGYRLSSAAGREIRLGEVSFASSVEFSVDAEGWTVAGNAVKAAGLEASLKPLVEQQDPQSSLERMRRAMEQKSGKSGQARVVRVYSNGSVMAQLFSVTEAGVVVLFELQFVSPYGGL